jgi:flavin reductase (DIM6/NTAB) family NADH-FMN oxidoreductase RutF
MPLLGHQEAYKLLVGSVVPRPIAFVSTLSAEGVGNLAPFSFFNVVCANPPTICFSTMRKGPDAVKKDSLANIEATGEFVVNVVDEDFIGPMNTCAAEFEPDESEWDACGLTAVPSEVVAPPRVGESPVQMECRLKQVIEMGDQPGSGTLIIGEVVRMHVRDDLLENGRIVTERWNPIGRMAGATYVRCRDTFELERPKAPVR